MASAKSIPNAAEHGRLGGHISWSRTADRSARTRKARAASPASIEYHVSRLDPALFADATRAQKLDAAESARRAYFARLAGRSRASRQRQGLMRDVTGERRAPSRQPDPTTRADDRTSGASQ
jgi:hypothetical protein